MISEVVNELLEDKDIKAVVTIYVPEGKTKSLRTFNPKLGIKRWNIYTWVYWNSKTYE